ncbi:AfsR/SARP family transcriptional regulator [Actinoallomurus iriomotensis]|uniref:AfsR/SARP family transcriptional regulator n=1 Tax=Actinoallomurus iriomotensis TaxID=478107 RepID=UPI00255652C7|nr:AfsR/SARP family transcriptional regulator [Actinoallomurus iriomotensis]
MKFRLLGPFQLLHEEKELTPTAPKVRCVLALLVLRHNRVVQSGQLIRELWGDRPPVSAQPTLQTYIYKIRKMLDESGQGPDVALLTRPYGYMLTSPPEDVDVYHFERLVDDGRSALSSDPVKAVELLTQALDLWRGPAFADVATGELLSAQLTQLEERRLGALELKIEAKLQMGDHDTCISELKDLTATHPLREGFYAKLMLALYRSGRRSEALETYQRLRRTIINELGLEPSKPLREMQQAILSADASLDMAPAHVEPVRQKAHLPATPAQLPPNIASLVGREDLLRSLETRVLADMESGGTAAITVITGMPGVGKSATALALAHAIEAHFPDGQFYAQLQNRDGSAVAPADILAEFLQAIGIAQRDLPRGLEERGKVFRSWCAKRRVLVLLNDVVRTEQVPPLLPGARRCATIVTSTSGLGVLADALTVKLEPLELDPSVRVLETIAGRERVEEERGAAERIARRCCGIPLALRCAGGRLAELPGLPLDKFADQLANYGRLLEELGYSGLDIRQRFDLSYAQLLPEERSALRLLCMLPRREFGARQAAGLLCRDEGQAETILARLVQHHFLRVASVNGEVHYSFHDLHWIYARTRLDQEIAEGGWDLSFLPNAPSV